MKESKHLQAFKASKLQAGETVQLALKAFAKDAALEGELILTDQRICYFKKGFLGETFETIGVDKISSVESKSVMGFRKLKIFTSHDELEVQVIASKPDFDAFYARLESLRHSKPSTTPAPSSLADELTKLAALREAGILTGPEFDQQKARLLG